MLDSSEHPLIDTCGATQTCKSHIQGIAEHDLLVSEKYC